MDTPEAARYQRQKRKKRLHEHAVSALPWTTIVGAIGTVYVQGQQAVKKSSEQSVNVSAQYYASAQYQIDELTAARTRDSLKIARLERDLRGRSRPVSAGVSTEQVEVPPAQPPQHPSAVRRFFGSIFSVFHRKQQ